MHSDVLRQMLGIVLVLGMVGVGLWVVNSIQVIDPKFKKIINIVVTLIAIVWLLKVFGLFDGVIRI